MIKDIKKEQHHEINFQWAAPSWNAVLTIIIFFFCGNRCTNRKIRRRVR